MNVYAIFRIKTIFALALASLFSHMSYSAEIEQTVRIRTASVDSHKVAVTTDQGLFGIDCDRGNLIFPTPSGRIPMLSYDVVGSVSMLPPDRSRAVAIETESLELLCSSPLSSEFVLVVTKDTVVAQSQWKGGLFKMADTSMARPYMIDDIRVAVTDRFRLVGLDCDENAIVLQNHNGYLPMNKGKTSRFAPYREGHRKVTDGSLDVICSKQAVMSDLELSFTGLQTQQVSVKPVSINARAK